jgi:hypothetical protein
VKRTAKIASVLLASLFVITFLPSSIIQPVYGSSGAAVFCPSYYVGEPYEVYDEIGLAESTCEAIASMLDSRYGMVILKVNESATHNNYIGYIDMLGNLYDEVGFFSKGHRNLRNENNWGTIGLYDHWGPSNESTVWDYEDIEPYTDGANFRFVFIWHCDTAQLYKETPVYSRGEDEYTGGMPYVFTHDWDMNYYGQDTGYHVFLGWIGESANFFTEFPDQQPWGGWQYAHFAYLFFAALTESYPAEMNYNVEGALNFALNYMSNMDFTCSYLFEWLVVWGCEDIGLPY